MVPPDPTREIYPGAPLKLVACEVVFQAAPGAEVDRAKQPVYEELASDYPVVGPAPGQEMRLEVGPKGSNQSVLERGFRFLNRERTQSVVVTPSSLIVETSAYSRFELFRESILQAVGALAEHLRITAATRVGLRYIDEISLSTLPDHRFDGYFAAEALAPAVAIEGVGSPDEFLTTTGYRVGDDRLVVRRAGRVNQPVVTPAGPLKIPRLSAGPLFVIDIDCAWQADSTAFEPFAAESLERVLSTLHAPIRALFESTITEKLRNEVLRKESAS